MQEIKFDEKNLIINNNNISLVRKQILTILTGKNLMLIMFLNALENLILKINYYLI